jgi:magnesium transporter
MVVLAFLMPIVASMGGNAGMQTLAVTVRTIATNDLTENNFTSNVIKEFSIGILNGIIFAVISAFIVQIWFQDSTLSIIISISMVPYNDYCRTFWYFGSSYFKKNEY